MFHLSTISAVLSPITNPIIRSEFRHQRFIIQNSRSGWVWIALAILLVAPALVVSILYTVGVLTDRIPFVEFYALPSSLQGGLGVLLLITNLSLYPVVTLVTLALARNSIAREKNSKTWALLRLTDIPDWEIVVGKWWASLRALNGDHFMVTILRVGLAAYYIGVLLPGIHTVFDNTTASYASYFAIIALFLIVQSLLDAMLTAAIGILAAIPDDTAGTVVTSAAMVLRFVLAILVMLWFIQIMAKLRYSLLDAVLYAGFGIFLTGLFTLMILLLANQILKRV